MSEKFNNKNILLFSPFFFGYGKAIADKLQSLGSTVDFFDERPDNDFFTKALVRIDKNLMTRKIEKYYNKIFKDLKQNNYDYVFFLNPESISVKSIQYLKGIQEKAVFVLYMWDSLKNKKNVLDLLPFFDVKYSFDKTDCKNPKQNFQFRPLFFLDEYKNAADQGEQNEIDLLFVGTVHSDRYKLLNTLKDICDRLEKRTFYYMFVQSKIIFFARKLTDRNFRKSNINEFKFESLAQQEIIELVKKSNCILDIQHPAQSGLTMRAIEMLGAKKKLITTNKEIMSYDFYNANNILYIDRSNPTLEISFFDGDYIELSKDVYFKYSLDGWLQDIFFS